MLATETLPPVPPVPPVPPIEIESDLPAPAEPLAPPPVPPPPPTDWAKTPWASVPSVVSAPVAATSTSPAAPPCPPSSPTLSLKLLPLSSEVFGVPSVTEVAVELPPPLPTDWAKSPCERSPCVSTVPSELA